MLLRLVGFYPFPGGKILAFTKLKAYYTDGKFDDAKIVIPLFDRVENIMGKPFCPFPSTFYNGHLSQSHVILYLQSRLLTTPKNNAFENIVGKRAFSPVPTMFLEGFFFKVNVGIVLEMVIENTYIVLSYIKNI